jgi:hypothetical protein
MNQRNAMNGRQERASEHLICKAESADRINPVAATVNVVNPSRPVTFHQPAWFMCCPNSWIGGT